MDILLETDTHLFWEEGDIFCFKYKVPVVDFDVARNGLILRQKITNNIPKLVYADCTNVKEITGQARKYYASELGSKTTIALALLVPTMLTKILATFFLNFNRPKMPTRLFNSKEKAIQWLLDFKK